MKVDFHSIIEKFPSRTVVIVIVIVPSFLSKFFIVFHNLDLHDHHYIHLKYKQDINRQKFILFWVADFL